MRFQSNALRKYATKHFLNHRRILEWANVCEELADLLEREWKWHIPDLPTDVAKCAPYDAIHRALLAGAPRQFGLWDRENKAYRSASGGFFAVFPGSGVFMRALLSDYAEM